MSNFISRNILMCVVPTVIVIFSVFWLRRKKKIKSDAHNPDASDSKANEECNSDMLHESCNETNNISSVQYDEPIQETEITRRNVLHKDESYDQSFNAGLSFLLSNHIENDTIHSNNISANTIVKKEAVDNEMVPNHHMTHIDQSHHEESQRNQSTNILKSPPIHGESLSVDSEIRSDDSESGIIDTSRFNCISDELESLGLSYTEESFNVSDGFTSPEDEIQVRKSVAHELESNRASLDHELESNRASLDHELESNRASLDHELESNRASLDPKEILQLSNNNDCHIGQKIVEIVDVEKNLDSLEGSDSESSDMLINAFKEIIESGDSFDVQSPDHVQCATEDSVNSNLSSLKSNVIYEPDTVFNSSRDTNHLNTITIPSTEKNPTKLTINNENDLNYIERSRAVDNTDDSLPDFNSSETTASLISCNSSETTASLISEESEKVSFKEIDLSEHFNINSDTNINSRSWKASDVQQLAVLSSNKIAESLLDFKTGNLTSECVYEFDLPQELCGRLIGRQGKTVKGIKERSNANVFIKRHAYDPELKVVVVEGNQLDVDNALEIIRRKYPPSQFPQVTLEQTNVISSLNVAPGNLPLHLPDGASCDVILSSLVSAGHFFLQQPTHPTYPSLSTLDQCMIDCYSNLNTPLLPQPIQAGVICAAPVLRGWYRAEIVSVTEDGSECGVKFVDYGGFSTLLTSSMRQIRMDFMTFPFQATECYLANVKPINRDIGWTVEARAVFEELAQGQILQAFLVGYHEDGCPYVQLYRVQGISNTFINRELVERGHAVWVDSRWDPH